MLLGWFFFATLIKFLLCRKGFCYAIKTFATQKSLFLATLIKFLLRKKAFFATSIKVVCFVFFCFLFLWIFCFFHYLCCNPVFLICDSLFFATPVILLQFFFLAFISFIFAPQFIFVSNAVFYFCLKHWKLSYPWFFFLFFLYFSFAYFISICISVFFAAHFFPFYIFFVFVFYCYSTFLNIPHALSYLLLVASLLLATFFWPLLAM